MLFAGGTGGVPYPHPEVYDPATGQFTLTDRLPSVRIGHAMVRLADGRVLLVGGNDGATTTAEAFLWNPSNGLWSRTDPLPAPRLHPTLTLLPDGTVLAAGGFAPSSSFGLAAAEAWLYVPDTGHWRMTGSLRQARGQHRAVRLPSGLVLVVGGYIDLTGVPEPTTTRAELYDWRTGVFTEVSPMRFSRVTHETALLPSGEVLVAGGGNGAGRSPETEEIYSPATNIWRQVPRLLVPRGNMAFAVLPNGTVLAAGGYERATANGLSSAEIFTRCPAP